MKQIVLSRTPLHCNALYPLPQFEDTNSAPFLIGQYELNETNKELREGKIDLVCLEESTLKTKSSLGLKCGIFDIVPVWSTSNSQIVSHQVAAGCTDGTVKLINIGKTARSSDEDEDAYNVSVAQTFEMGEEMVTSCFVHQTGSNNNSESKNDAPSSILIASTHHKGTVSILKQHTSSSSNKTIKPFKLSFDAHEFDAWSIAPAYNEIGTIESNVFFTGGDDAKLKLWDLRSKMTFKDDDDDNKNGGSDGEAEDIVRCQSHCSGFGAGVVSIVPQSEHILLVGSYDEHVYTIDTRMLAPGGKSKPAVGEKGIVSKLRLGGGGWRLREVSRDTCEKSFGGVGDEEQKCANKSSSKKIFAVAAMQAGAEVISFDSETNKLEQVAWPGCDVNNEEQRWIHHTALKNAELSEEEDEKKDSEGQENEDVTTTSSEQEANKIKVAAEEPLIYDVCQLGGAGKYMEGGSASFATVSFYTNEVRCWRN